jgi:2OG-Fe(II) oxygenase superfamily
LKYDCAEEVKGKAPLIFAFWQHLSTTLFKGHTLVRCYANAQAYGSDGTIHTDSRSDDSYTAVYYPHAFWSPDWGGETVLFNFDKTDIVASIYPKPNRLLVFKGNIPHVARGVSRICPVLRVTLMFKSINGPIDECEIKGELASASPPTLPRRVEPPGALPCQAAPSQATNEPILAKNGSIEQAQADD